MRISSAQQEGTAPSEHQILTDVLRERIRLSKEILHHLTVCPARLGLIVTSLR